MVRYSNESFDFCFTDVMSLFNYSLVKVSRKLATELLNEDVWFDNKKKHGLIHQNRNEYTFVGTCHNVKYWQICLSFT